MARVILQFIPAGYGVLMLVDPMTVSRSLMVGKLTKFLSDRWERILFGLVGLACLLFTFRMLISGRVEASAAVFAMAFFSFFYSNLARFKKFKGLGFEAELWEDKQKEAAHLIDRLKSVVAVYTREIVMGNVMRGRWGGNNWEARWKLFDELVQKHTELGQDIDFSSLRKDVENVFLFDLCNAPMGSVGQSIHSAVVEAQRSLREKFGNPITDNEGFSREWNLINVVKTGIENPFKVSKTRNLAQDLLTMAHDAEVQLKALGTDITFDQNALARLRSISKIWEERPIDPTPQLLEWVGQSKMPS